MDTSNDKTYLNSLLNSGQHMQVLQREDELSLPCWYDEKLFKKGQEYYRRNLFAMFMGMLCGLIMVLAIPSIRKVLICTNKSSTPRTAYRRYVKTIFHIVEWHKNDLSPKSNAWKSICMVNKLHRAASHLSSCSNSGMISQKDMALTQFGFMGLITLKAKLLGIPATEEFLESTIHFWRVIGFLMGIEDEFNICTESWVSTKPRLEAILHEVYSPLLSANDSDFLSLTDALISGMWSFNPFLTREAFLYFTKRLAECNGYEYLKSDCSNDEIARKSKKLYKTMSLYDRIILCMLVLIIGLAGRGPMSEYTRKKLNELLRMHTN